MKMCENYLKVRSFIIVKKMDLLVLMRQTNYYCKSNKINSISKVAIANLCKIEQYLTILIGKLKNNKEF